MNQLSWINTIKALCMIGVYILHTQAYVGAIGGGNTLIDNAIHPFYVNAFFVVSGYLFYRKWMTTPSGVAPGKKEFSNLVFRLLIPTIVFSSIIYIPKILFHSNEVALYRYFYDVFGGVSYWFTSAMVIAQLVLLLVLKIGMRRIWQFIILSLAIIAVMPILKKYFPAAFPWYWKTGLASIALMTSGGLIYACRGWLKRHISVILGFSFIAYIVAIVYAQHSDNVVNALMSVNFNVSGIVISAIGISFIFALCYKWNPELAFLQFIGKNSIVFYFLSGVIPAFMSVIPCLKDSSSAVNTLLMSSVAVIIGALATWIITRYLPFMTDLRRLKAK